MMQTATMLIHAYCVDPAAATAPSSGMYRWRVDHLDACKSTCTAPRIEPRPAYTLSPNVSELLRLLRGRRLSIIGDSVPNQYFHQLALRRSTWVTARCA